MSMNVFQARRKSGGWQLFFSRAGERLQTFLLDTVENAVREVSRWVKSVATLYGIGALLGLVALFALANGLALGVMELGLPPYAAWFILAVVTGGVGYFLFKHAGKKGIVERTDEREERRLGLSFRIVKSAPRATSRHKGRSRRPVYDVHPGDAGWEVTGGSKKRVYSTKDRAVLAARRAARSGSGHVVIHRTDGRIQEN